MSTFLETIQSPVTGSSNVVLEEELQVSLIIDAYNKLNIDVSQYFKNIDSVKVYRCLDTQYRFYYPFSLNGDSKLYEELQKQSGYYRIKIEHQTAKKFIKPGAKVLEVGCGSGLFLKELEKEGMSCVGLEFNDAAIFAGNKDGLEIIKQDICEYSIKHPEKYDVVCSFQVLEHVSLAHEFISASLLTLKKGGKLIIGVPNNNPFLYQFDKYHALNLPPHHMGLWNKPSLQSLQMQFSIKLEKIIAEELHEDEHEHYFNLLIQNLKGRSEVAGTIYEFLLTKLRPFRLRFMLQKIFSSFIEGRNILVIYSKI
jgi:2-polyprenyl-3-methyl-5-hydroxy-6-metoxy-1,4-benzoquinol methylase